MLSRPKLYIGFTLIVILMLAALLDSLSRGATDPSLSTALNPLSAASRVAWVEQELGRRDPPPDLDEVARQLDRAATLEPIDARIYGLKGEAAMLREQPQEARSLFEQGLKTSPTEFYSLRRLIVMDLEAGDSVAALGNLNVFLKRWPRRFQDVENVFPVIMSSDSGYASVADYARDGAQWRGRLLTFLASKQELSSLAYRLLLDLRQGATPLTEMEVNDVISYLFAKGQRALAYQTFALMQMERGAGDGLAFVTNADFSAPKATRQSPFEWMLPGVTGAEAAIAPDNAAGLRISFRDKVVRGTLARQMVMLPPGPKELSFVVTAERLESPKGLNWTVRCINNNAVLIETPIEPGTYADRATTVRFTVPDGCDAQELALSSGVVSVSMRYRYDGQVTVKKVEIANAED